MNRSPHLVHDRRSVRDSGAVSAYILEIKAVLVRSDGPVGYGVDDLGREFAVPLDGDLALEVATALDDGRRPIVAVERGRPLTPRPGQRVVGDRVIGRRDKQAGAVSGS